MITIKATKGKNIINILSVYNRFKYIYILAILFITYNTCGANIRRLDGSKIQYEKIELNKDRVVLYTQDGLSSLKCYKVMPSSLPAGIRTTIVKRLMGNCEKADKLYNSKNYLRASQSYQLILKYKAYLPYEKVKLIEPRNQIALATHIKQRKIQIEKQKKKAQAQKKINIKKKAQKIYFANCDKPLHPSIRIGQECQKCGVKVERESRWTIILGILEWILGVVVFFALLWFMDFMHVQQHGCHFGER